MTIFDKSTKVGNFEFMKCGTLSSISDNASTGVVYNTAFMTTPCVTLTQASGSKEHTLYLSDVSTTGFVANVIKAHTGGGDSIDIHWIACDIGDP